jgi:hypothetical protein
MAAGEKAALKLLLVPRKKYHQTIVHQVAKSGFICKEDFLAVEWIAPNPSKNE